MNRALPVDSCQLTVPDPRTRAVTTWIRRVLYPHGPPPPADVIPAALDSVAWIRRLATEAGCDYVRDAPATVILTALGRAAR